MTMAVERESMGIEANFLTRFEVSSDGSAFRLYMMTAAGETHVELPYEAISMLLMTLPRIMRRALGLRHGNPALMHVYPLGDWGLHWADDGRTLIFTLKTADGFEVSFGLRRDVMTNIAESVLEAVGPAKAPPRLVN